MTPIIYPEYFREYRSKLGFTNQSKVASFFGAKDITANVDFDYINLFNKRLFEIIEKINTIVSPSIKNTNIQLFEKEFIQRPFSIIKENNIFNSLNNQGRRPEGVYFSWMRGYIISNFFIPSIGKIFDVDIKEIKTIGDDDLKKVDTFKRTPKADLEIKLRSGQVTRLEIQSGFTGINDIKQHKVLEAKKVSNQSRMSTIVIHFDLYNGQVAFVDISSIKENDIHWITRQQMEGQTVFNIDQNFFKWKLTENPILFSEL